MRHTRRLHRRPSAPVLASGIACWLLVNACADREIGPPRLENGVWDHCYSLRDVETRVPLAIGLSQGVFPESLLEGAPVSTLDIHPTLLSLLAIDDDGATPSGRDLREVLPEPRAISSFRREVTIRDGRWKLYAKREMEGEPLRVTALYDLARDPDERHEVLAANPAKAERLFADLRPHLSPIEARERDDRDMIEQLKAIGYIQ